MTEKQKLNLEELRQRQFEIVRRGLREALQALQEMEDSFNLETPVEQVVVEPYQPDEIEFDMSEIENELIELESENSVIDVTDDMIVEVEEIFVGEETLSPLIKLENFLAQVQRRKRNLEAIRSIK